MKGIPDSPFPHKRVNHVIDSRKGGLMNIKGEIIKGNTKVIRNLPESHIPLSDWMGF